MVGRETVDDPPSREDPSEATAALALVVIHCADPSRVGETLRFAGETATFGREEGSADPAVPRAFLVRERPGESLSRPPLDLPALSRDQVRIFVGPSGFSVENTGRRGLIGPNGNVSKDVHVGIGECFEIDGQVAFVCVARPAKLPRVRGVADLSFAFGEADGYGLVGEGVLAWELREQIAFVAGRAAHVLVLGPSGAGKEVVAQAIHAQSTRARKTLVSRSAATIPAGIADAELFGNLANYPNPGTPERKGLFGEADRGMLFLDELGELPEELQARLLRVLDERGEYQRLGEARVRRADIRLLAATNRPLTALKHDVAARFRLRLGVPGLDARREDVPLLARHLLRRVAKADSEMEGRFFSDNGLPRIAPSLVRALVSRDYRTHVRELDALLWLAMATSRGDTVDLTPQVREELSLAAEPSSVVPRRDSRVLTAEEVRSALDRNGGMKDKAWRDLGLANRFVLHRLMKKHGIEVP